MNTFACRSLRRLDLLGANSREGDRYAGLRSLRNICVVKILKILNFLKSFWQVGLGHGCHGFGMETQQRCDFAVKLRFNFLVSKML